MPSHLMMSYVYNGNAYSCKDGLDTCIEMSWWLLLQMWLRAATPVYAWT